MRNQNIFSASLFSIAIASTALVAAPSAHAALAVNASSDCNALAGLLLSGGSGVSITGCSLQGVTGQQGSFTGGLSAGIGIDTGVILTSGSVNNAPGPNSQDGATSNVNSGTDANLQSLIPQTVFDANVLNISFTTSTGSLFFNYVFASEEYNEFVNSSFNDVFGFFVDGSNIALIPGTSTPVSINNVNCGTDGLTSTANCALFNNNDPSNGGPFFNIQYDGFTDVFSAAATGLNAGQTYTIKLAVGDAGDSSLDSAVFLQGGSFSGVNPNPVPEPGTLALLGLGLAGAAAARRRA